MEISQLTWIISMEKTFRNINSKTMLKEIKSKTTGKENNVKKMQMFS